MRVHALSCPILAVITALVTCAPALAQQSDDASVANKAGTPDELLRGWLRVRHEADVQYERLREYSRVLKRDLDMPVLDEIDMRKFAEARGGPSSEELAKQVQPFLEEWKKRGKQVPVYRLLPWLLQFEVLEPSDLRIGHSLVEAWGLASDVFDAKEALAACKSLEARLRKEIAAARGAKADAGKTTDPLARLRDWIPALQWDAGRLEGAEWLLTRLGAMAVQFDKGEAIPRDQLVADRMAGVVEKFRDAIDKDDRDAMQRLAGHVSKNCSNDQLGQFTDKTVNAIKAVTGYFDSLQSFEKQKRDRTGFEEKVASTRAKIEEQDAKREGHRKKKEKYKKDRDASPKDSRNYQKNQNGYEEQDRLERQCQGLLRTLREHTLPQYERALQKLGGPLEKPVFDPR